VCRNAGGDGTVLISLWDAGVYILPSAIAVVGCQVLYAKVIHAEVVGASSNESFLVSLLLPLLKNLWQCCSQFIGIN